MVNILDFPRTVYAIRHNKTGKVYIGSSKHPEQRVKSHLYALRAGRHSVGDMQSDFNTYGEDYTITYLEEITKHEDSIHEYEWMRKFKSYIRGAGYNYNDHYKQDKTKPNKVTYRDKINALLKATEDIETLKLIVEMWQRLVDVK